MNQNRKRLISIILVIVLLILSGVAIFIAVRLTQDQAPDDSSAGTCVAGSDSYCQVISGLKTGYRCNCVGVTNGFYCGWKDDINQIPNSCYVWNCAQSDSTCAATPTNNCPSGTTISGTCGTNGCAANQKPRWTCDPNGSYDNRTPAGCASDPSCGTTGDGSRTSLSSCTATCSDVDGCKCPTNPVCTAGSGANIANGVNCGGTSTSCNYCAIYTCSFDSNGDDQCTLADEGASVTFASGSACTIGSSVCGQVDFYPTDADARAGTNYCSHTGNPAGNCQDTSNPPTTPSETVTCYKCTDRVDDLNTCENITINGSTCPSGYTTNSVCSQAVGGACPVQSVTKTCYKCTDTLSDADLCESFTVNSNVCPAGSTETAGACEDAVGGVCPITTTENLTCYRCTTSLTDGNTCESFVTTNDSCPAGSTETAGECEDALGGVCPGELPETALFDNDRDNRIALGFIAIILGILFYKYDLTQRSLNMLGNFVNIDRELKKKEKNRLKKDRSLKNFETKVEKEVLKKK